LGCGTGDGREDSREDWYYPLMEWIHTRWHYNRDARCTDFQRFHLGRLSLRFVGSGTRYAIAATLAGGYEVERPIASRRVTTLRSKVEPILCVRGPGTRLAALMSVIQEMGLSREIRSGKTAGLIDAYESYPMKDRLSPRSRAAGTTSTIRMSY